MIAAALASAAIALAIAGAAYLIEIREITRQTQRRRQAAGFNAMAR